MKNGFILLFIFCGVLSTYSQSSKFYAGVKTGFGIPNLTSGAKSTPLSEGYASRLGFYTGLVAEYQTNTLFGLRAEVNYSVQGGKRDGMQALPLSPEMGLLWQLLPSIGITPDNYMYANIKSDAILNYLEIPVMAKFSFNIAQGIDFYMQAGPYMGILLNAKNVTSGSSGIYIDKEAILSVDAILQLAQLPPIGSQSFDHNEDITGDIQKFNVGGQGAIGFGVKFGRGKLFLEGGGNYGFIPIQKNDANGTNHTGAGTVTVGYLVQL